MAYVHHGTIRKYVAALINEFNDIEIQHDNSSNESVSKNIPVVYSTKEKSRILDNHTNEQLLSGNYTVLPRCSLSLSGMNKSSQRTTNKNVKVNKLKTDDTIDYLFNSVPYEFTFELIFQCRGMNEATQIIEQICPKFNPTINIDVFDANNLDEPTRIPVLLNGVDIETEEYSEFSANIFTVSFSLTLVGNIYPPIKTIKRVQEFKINLNKNLSEKMGESYNTKSIMNWDVNKNSQPENLEITNTEENIITPSYPPVIHGIVGDVNGLGENNLTVQYEDPDSLPEQLTFDWEIVTNNINGTADISFTGRNAILTVDGDGDIEVQVSITDQDNNYASANRLYTIDPIFIKPTITGIYSESNFVGDTSVFAIVEDPDSSPEQLTFEWEILIDGTLTPENQTPASIVNNPEKNGYAILTTYGTGTVQIQATVTDEQNLSDSFSETIVIDQIKKSLTSWTYPVLEVDELNASSDIQRLKTFLAPKPSDELSASSNITNLKLKEVVVKHDQPQEDELTASSDITDLKLKAVVIRHDQPQEDELTANSDITDLKLKAVAIRYDAPQEDELTASSDIVGLTLS